MASWQRDFYLVPTDQLSQSEIDRDKDTDLVDMNLDISSINPILSDLESTPSWHDDMKILGVEDSNRVDIVTQGTTVESIFFRFDKSELDFDFIETAISIAKKLNLMFLSEKNERVQNDANELIAAINSPR